MTKYIIKRLLLAVLTVFIICAITFFLMHAIPGGPFNREKALDPATIAALNARYNLDKPLVVQFGIYIKELFKGDFGVSLKNGREISSIISESFPISCKVGLRAISIALICGTVFGSIAALMRNKWPDRVIVFLSTLFTAVPSFVLATLLLLVFCIKLGWVPVWSPNNPSYVLPVIALSAYPMAYITRLSKTSMLDALSHRKGKGRTQVDRYIQARPAELPHSRDNLCGPADRLHNHRLHDSRDHIHHRRHRQQVRKRHNQPGLHHDNGDHDLPCHPYGSGDAHMRPAV